MRAMSLCFVLMLALATTFACGTPTFVVQQYAGAVRAPETIAIVRVDGNRKVLLLSLDGEATDVRVTADARLHIEVLPGDHTLWVQNLGAPESPARSLAFRAEAGKVYRVEFVRGAVEGDGPPHVYAVDRSSNALLADVTLSEPPPAPSSPSRPARRTVPPAPIIEEAAPASAPVGGASSSSVGEALPAAPASGAAAVDAGAPLR